jgi:ligand-binding sensor domain-containing protein
MEWQVYRAADLGLDGENVYALALGSDDQIWAGTSTGVAALSGSEPGRRAQTSASLTAAGSGLAEDWVTALAVEPYPGGDRVWVGTSGGLSRLDTASGEWHDFRDAVPAHVNALLPGADGRLWVGTRGEGLAVWDGETWQSYRTGNSDIPHNTVTALAEVEPGVLWVGTAAPSEVGGVLARFDGQTWKHYTRQDSGSSMAEPLAIAQDGQGRWWIGTRTSGIDIYQVDR